jgi:hypothetical protein
MTNLWDQYLTVPDAERRYGICRDSGETAYAPLRETITRLIDRIMPETAACLGAGVLNDIPYDALVARCQTLYLVDWLPGIVDSGIARAIVSRAADGACVCAYCSVGRFDKAYYCTRYRPSHDPGRQVCGSFSAADAWPACASFERGTWPHVLAQDITGGYASSFARQISESVDRFGSWREAFRQADRVAQRAVHGRQPIEIPDSSVDLVISSMVVSQFEHEPYGFFSALSARRLGPVDNVLASRLRGPMEQLRNRLLTAQIERHCDEIRRILAADGACFIAFELFHIDPDSRRWFLVAEMQKALGILARHFDFDFDVLPARESVLRVIARDAPSIVQCLVLRQKAELPEGAFRDARRH